METITEQANRLGVRLPEPVASDEKPEPEPIITTAKVREAVADLASDTWKHREEEGAIDRLHQVRTLTEAQLRDDVMSTAGRGRSPRIGGQWVIVTDRWNERYEAVQPAYTPDQVAFQAGIEPVLGELTGEERILIRWTYDQMIDQRTIAKLLHVTQPTVSRRLAALHERLRDRLAELFLREEEKPNEDQ